MNVPLIPRATDDGTPEIDLNELQVSMKEQVAHKVESKLYTFEDVNCAICGGADYEVVTRKDRYGLFCPVNVCRQCGFLYTSPRMTQESYGQFYNSEYRKLYGGKSQVDEAFFTAQYHLGRLIYAFLLDHNLLNSSIRNVLEVGCGSGGILSFFKELGYQVKGIDLGEEYVEYGKRKGLDLECCTLGELSGRFTPDLIIYSHVMEHILDVNSEIEAISRISDPDTIVYIEVPGVFNVHQKYKMNFIRYFQNAHVSHFSLQSLSRLFAKHGFVLQHGNEYVKSVFQKGNYSIDKRNEYSRFIKYMTFNERWKGLWFMSSSNLKDSSYKMAARLLDVLNLKRNVKKLLYSIFRINRFKK